MVGITLRAAEEATWQPVATVPRDGSPVMLFVRGADRKEYIWLDRWNSYLSRWEAAGASRPTHWRPVPGPPPPSPA
ncbi:hypothetical protein LOC54_06620 [Acetobacter sp. AN02]|uniref:hypothetical protein n=1 Tax=Acetobacter sp. AN02 TaxID=2894186 RepID=UPI0024344A57|nr:hypothetical protein [Acetobacter sp. AN02]MDG6094784.1 hypothetical protein [Acetobacter sp. AN02]